MIEFATRRLTATRTKKLQPFTLLYVFWALTFSLWLASISQAGAFSPEEDLTARAMLLLDAKTGRILYQKDADVRLPPASTTKILTAIVALESGRKLSETLTVSKAATRVPASKLYLKPGQTISIEDLLYAILLSSANDASLVLAEGIAGSVERFTAMMTKKAHEIGATDTNFTNPHGLTAADHYSTARDLAVIFRYAMRNPAFREIVQTKISSVRSITASRTASRKRPKTRRISVRNHNRLLWNFDGAIGGKTGYTHAAQKCFVGAVERNGVTLVVSILGSRNLWGDTRQLLEYGFDNYETLRVASQSAGPARTAGQLAARSERNLTSPVKPQENETPRDGAAGYVLQVASFREAERAQALQEVFSKRGFEVFVERISVKEGETNYRVRIGPYAEYLEAQETAQEILEQSGFRPLIVPMTTSLEMSGNGSQPGP